MLQYDFMRLAIMAGLLLSIAIPLVGSTAVYKRLSMSGDALAHTSLAGVAIGLACGFNPLLVSVIVCVIAFLIMEFLRRKFPRFSELGVAIVLSAGIGVAGIASSFTSSANFDSYLFGSILLIDRESLWLIVALVVIVAAFYIVFYWPIFFMVYDEEAAKVRGIPVNAIGFFQSLLTALTIAVSAKIIGSLIVSSLMVVPVATALQLKKSYKATLLISIAFSFASVLIGLVVSYYWGLRPGATIVIVSLLSLIFAMSLKFIEGKYRRIKARKKAS